MVALAVGKMYTVGFINEWNNINDPIITSRAQVNRLM